MLHDLEKKILDITKRDSDLLEKESGSVSTMTDEEIRSYVQYVLNEIGKRKKASI